MKKIISCFLFILSAIWFIVAALKLVMALNGQIDPMRDGDSASLFADGVLQLLLAAAAFYLAKKFRKPGVSAGNSEKDYAKDEPS